MRSSYPYSPDLEFCSNNGVIAIRPSQTGRLKDLCSLTFGGEQRVWCFADVASWTNDNGDEVIDYQKRGVVVGNYQEGRDFIEICQKIGVRVESAGFHVPFSNGCHHPEFGKDYSTWWPEEVVMMRIDLPTCGQILNMLQSVKA